MQAASTMVISLNPYVHTTQIFQTSLLLASVGWELTNWSTIYAVVQLNKPELLNSQTTKYTTGLQPLMIPARKWGGIILRLLSHLIAILYQLMHKRQILEKSDMCTALYCLNFTVLPQNSAHQLSSQPQIDDKIEFRQQTRKKSNQPIISSWLLRK